MKKIIIWILNKIVPKYLSNAVIFEVTWICQLTNRSYLSGAFGFRIGDISRQAHCACAICTHMCWEGLYEWSFFVDRFTDCILISVNKSTTQPTIETFWKCLWQFSFQFVKEPTWISSRFFRKQYRLVRILPCFGAVSACVRHQMTQCEMSIQWQCQLCGIKCFMDLVSKWPQKTKTQLHSINFTFGHSVGIINVWNQHNVNQCQSFAMDGHRDFFELERESAKSNQANQTCQQCQ